MSRLFITVIALIVGCFMAQSQPATRPTAAPPVEFDKFHFVVLMAAPNPPQLDAERARELQAQHLGHLSKMAEEGHMLVAGPFANRFDDRWRGLCLYDGSLTAEQVRELAEADPAVQAGTMAVAIMDWYTSKGALAFPMAQEMRKKAAESAE